METASIVKNAPLIKSQCVLRWNKVEADSALDPHEFKTTFAKFHVEGITDLDSEWMIPRRMVERVPHNRPFYHLFYSFKEIGVDVALAHNEVRISSDNSYQTWVDFRDEIDLVVNVLSAVLGKGDHHIDLIRLQYVDAFRRDILRGKSPADFVEDDLGITITLPHRLSITTGQFTTLSTFIDYLAEIDESTDFKLSIGEAKIDPDENVAICDTTVIRKQRCSFDSISGILNLMHDVSHDFFIRLIQPISNRFE
ncbi:MAG: TIGR04255 family protein [Bifidobacterium aquikefiri]|uniref:TIGR04255 family protein n=1 Tax=Bifidobacterium aquikefiri TaxID=1653207 RepID=A0A261G5P4_9BIFI|nr:TIGR04255 family protein [Bifidobacterium aquikefiri]OZG66751.1 hypothetical protein BAQU_0823 [Bifidobacterium aquikefiri]